MGIEELANKKITSRTEVENEMSLIRQAERGKDGEFQKARRERLFSARVPITQVFAKKRKPYSLEGYGLNTTNLGALWMDAIVELVGNSVCSSPFGDANGIVLGAIDADYAVKKLDKEYNITAKAMNDRFVTIDPTQELFTYTLRRALIKKRVTDVAHFYISDCLGHIPDITQRSTLSKVMENISKTVDESMWGSLPERSVVEGKAGSVGRSGRS